MADALRLGMSGVLASVLDLDGRRVELTIERWAHILATHPELARYLEEILGAIRSPDTRLHGRHENEEWYLVKDEGPSRWLQVVVAYGGGRGWIVTAFARRRLP